MVVRVSSIISYSRRHARLAALQAIQASGNDVAQVVLTLCPGDEAFSLVPVDSPVSVDVFSGTSLASWLERVSF